MITQLVCINGIGWQENITKAKNGNKLNEDIYMHSQQQRSAYKEKNID